MPRGQICIYRAVWPLLKENQRVEANVFLSGQVMSNESKSATYGTMDRKYFDSWLIAPYFLFLFTNI